MSQLQRFDRRSDDEDGFVLVFVAVLLVVLLLSAALVVDLGNGRQQQTQAQSIADMAALSGAGALSDATPDAVMQAFTYAFRSRSLLPPVSLAATSSCGATCSSYSVSGMTVQVSSPWNGFGNYVHVQVCWNEPALFSRVAGYSKLGVCGRASAKNDNVSSAGNGPPAAASCAKNELSTSANNPISTSGTLTATYSASQPIDPNDIVFIAPNAFGTLVRLSNTGDPLTGYKLTQNGNTATITYQLPGGLSTASASLFVHDAQQNDCGQAAWSSCPVSTHDDFFETDRNGNGIGDKGLGIDADADDSLSASAKANSALLADSDDSVFPALGQQVTAGATLGATYYDETPINPARTYLFLNGQPQPVSIAPPPPLNTIDNTTVGQVSPKASTITNNSGTVTVQLRDYLGDPIQGQSVALTNLSSGTASPASVVTNADAKATFTLSQPNATFTVIDQSANSLVIAGGSSPVAWPKPPQPTDNRGDYIEKISTSLGSTTANGWNSAFMYVFDADTNQQGGDCSLTQFAFRFAGGTPSNANSIALVE